MRRLPYKRIQCNIVLINDARCPMPDAPMRGCTNCGLVVETATETEIVGQGATALGETGNSHSRETVTATCTQPAFARTGCAIAALS